MVVFDRKLFLILMINFALSAYASAFGEEDLSQIEVNASQELSHDEIFHTDIILGNKDSKVIIVEYFAPTCAHCTNYHLNIFPEIKRKYIDTNKIAYITREVIGNRQDLSASILARCSGDKDLYMKLMNHIMITQNHWLSSKDYMIHLTKIAKEYGISESQYKLCVSNDSIAKILFDYARFVTSDSSFLGTPSFYINGQLFNGKYNIHDLSQIIDSQFREGV